ncbi:MAG: cation diffusion facilitator family transporter [Candidatus Kapaibacteriales bacterium]
MLYKSTYNIPKMDCPSEENLIRLKLDASNDIYSLEFDLDNRILFVYHLSADPGDITTELDNLKLGSYLVNTVEAEPNYKPKEKTDKKLLLIVLIINFLFFIIETIYGYLSNSMGLIGDGLDMLADSLVYGISLFAVGRTFTIKKIATKTAGYLQMILALVGFYEVISRFISDSPVPAFGTMIIVSILALSANAASYILLNKSKSKKENHIKASMIFTSNDIIINIGVIMSAVAVSLLDSRYPDLIIGGIIFTIVIAGAIRILRLK